MLGVDDRGHAAGAESAVVLVHGYLCLSPRAYWASFLPSPLRLGAIGIDVVVARMPRTGNVLRRAGRLAHQLSRLPHRRLVLVGHSMGGLDARLVASRLDPERRVRTVVTIGTPHGGSPAAEWVLNRRRWPAPLLRWIDRGALRDLTREGAHRLDLLMPDRPDVDYLAVGGACPPTRLPPAFRDVAAQVAADEPGPNDGFVPLGSALRWQGAVTLETDHLGLIGLPVGQRRPPAPAAATRILLTRLSRRPRPPAAHPH
jgi:triacylglycerol lipase